MRRLLLIDDDEHLGPPLAAWFARHGFELQQATTPEAGLARLQAGGFDAAILDVMLPGMDGFELCRTIRRTDQIPIVMLTARGEVMDRVVGLELGADDYVPKPFEPRELLARIQTILRRTAAPLAANPVPAAAGTLRFEGLAIDLDRRAVQRGGQPVELTSTEFELLVLLAATPGKVYSRDDILARLRGHAAEDIHSRAVDILVSRLRRKLEPLDPIRTLRNAGYTFAAVRGVKHRWRERFGHSLKGRLVALFLLLAMGTTAVFLFGMQRVLQNGWLAYARPMVADYTDRLAAEIGSPPSPERARALAERLPITVTITGPLVQFDNRPPRHRPWRHDDDDADGSDPAADWGLVRTTADGHRIAFGLARVPDASRPRILGWTTLAALLALTAAAYAAVRRLLQPLQAIGAGVQAYGQGDFSRPIAVARRDELGLLTERVNGMASNLSGMLQTQRALLLALSHELRSPLTRARVNAELVEEGPQRDALLRDLGEMRDLITSLLESERLAQGPGALQTEAVDLAAMVRDFAATMPAPVPLVLQLDETLGPVQADPARLKLLLRNLVENAQRHGAGAKPPEVFVRQEDDGRVALGVRDHGRGVTPAQLAQLGQPFWRPDDARSRASGGVGLGLYLCRRVAQAHGGELRLRQADPGLEVAALWPARAGENPPLAPPAPHSRTAP